MTESEWLAAEEPQPMLNFLGSRVSDRKLRLFACGCCRLAGFPNQKVRRAVEVAERFADGQANAADLSACFQAIWPNPGLRRPYLMGDRDGSSFGKFHAAMAAAAAAVVVAPGQHWLEHWATLPTWDDRFPQQPPWVTAADAVAWAASEAALFSCPDDYDTQMAAYDTAHRAALRDQAALVRDLFGNPARPVAFDPSWLTWHGGTIVRLAQRVRDGCFEIMSVLADALEDAGCADAAILNHCRQGGVLATGSRPLPRAKDLDSTPLFDGLADSGVEIAATATGAHHSPTTPFLPDFHARGCWVVDLLLAKK
jgi:hypothetical protein